MPIEETLESIKTNLGNAYAVVSRKNGTIPENKNISNLAAAINSIQQGGGGSSDIKLNPPTLSFGVYTTTSDPLVITNSYNGNFVESYDIYKGDTLLDTIEANLDYNIVNLRDYISEEGNHTINVVAKSSDFISSDVATITYHYGIYVTITKNLTNCTLVDNSNEFTKIGDHYIGRLTANEGYSFVGASVSIYMNGVDVTSTAYDGKYKIDIARITGDITITITFAAITKLSVPAVSLSGTTLTITSVTNAQGYDIYISGVLWRKFEETTIDLSDYLVIERSYYLTVKATAEGYSDSNPSSTISYTNSDGTTPTSTLQDNDWETIALVCQLGQAGTYWSVGDTKTDVGTDETTRTFRIVDMQGLYNKHVVFEQVELESGTYIWNNAPGGANSNANDYSVSVIRTTTLPSILEKYSSNLQNVINKTTIYVYRGASNNDFVANELLELNDKLFLPGVRELGGTTAQDDEPTTDIRFAYYTSASRIKYQNGVAKEWWTRTKHSNRTVTNTVDTVGRVGYPMGASYCYTFGCVAPCFAF